MLAAGIERSPPVDSSAGATAPGADGTWLEVCGLDDILPNTGVCALVADKQVALFRVGAGDVYALSNFDPFSQAFVLSRGIVGDRNGVAKVASPIFKQSFDLCTGRCLDDGEVAIAVYPVRVRAGRVEVFLAATRDRRLSAEAELG